MIKNLRVVTTFALATVVVLGLVSMASAITAPANGSFAYDIYDIGVNSILKGPIGFMCGVASVALGAVSAIRAQIMTAIPAILGGAALLKADAIVSSLGAVK